MEKIWSVIWNCVESIVWFHVTHQAMYNHKVVHACMKLCMNYAPTLFDVHNYAFHIQI